jgi:hypothetical protein
LIEVVRSTPKKPTERTTEKQTNECRCLAIARECAGAVAGTIPVDDGEANE